MAVVLAVIMMVVVMMMLMMIASDLTQYLVKNVVTTITVQH